MKQHPLSAAFPPMPSEELAALAADIKINGQHFPIVVFEDMVLDGWHRLLACKMIGKAPLTEKYSGKDPSAFVESANKFRRHMTASQRAMSVVLIDAWREKGKPKQSDKSLMAPGSQLQSNKEMAAKAGVGVETIKRAKAVAKDGSDAVKKDVVEGKITVKAAVAKLPKNKAKTAGKKEVPPEPPEVDLMKELERCDTEIRRLQRLVDSLKASDTLKELALAHEKFNQLEGRLQQSITTENEAKKQAAYSTKLLDNIRKTLSVSKNSEIIPKLNKLVVL